MCADTITANYHWVKPEISGSPTTWGVKLNADLDLIDNQLFMTTTNATVIGQITMFAGATAPTNWVLCDGTVYPNSFFPLLAPVLNNIYGGVVGLSNAVPDLRGAFPIGVDGSAGVYPLGTTGGEEAHSLVVNEMPSHDHQTIVDLTDPGHDHPIVDPTHNHQVGVQSYGTTSGSDNLTVFSGSGTVTSTANSSTGITVQGNITGVDVTVEITHTGGSGLDGAPGTPHNNIPPYLAMNFIIRYA